MNGHHRAAFAALVATAASTVMVVNYPYKSAASFNKFLSQHKGRPQDDSREGVDRYITIRAGIPRVAERCPWWRYSC